MRDHWTVVDGVLHYEAGAKADAVPRTIATSSCGRLDNQRDGESGSIYAEPQVKIWDPFNTPHAAVGSAGLKRNQKISALSAGQGRQTDRRVESVFHSHGRRQGDGLFEWQAGGRQRRAGKLLQDATSRFTRRAKSNCSTTIARCFSRTFISRESNSAASVQAPRRTATMFTSTDRRVSDLCGRGRYAIRNAVVRGDRPGRGRRSPKPISTLISKTTRQITSEGIPTSCPSFGKCVVQMIDDALKADAESQGRQPEPDHRSRRDNRSTKCAHERFLEKKSLN